MDHKFYMLIKSLSYDSIEPLRTGSRRHSSCRSKVYTTKAEAVEKAQRYIQEGMADRYFVMEAVFEVRKIPVATEIIELNKDAPATAPAPEVEEDEAD